jgi:hypothetical protein
MSKDKNDNKTIDPFLVKKRGRPSTGSSMTAAQRKAEQRKRDRQLITNENLTDATITALCEQLQHRVSMGDIDLVKGITLELMKRARLAFKNNVTVTKKSSPSLPGKAAAINNVTVTKKQSPATVKREAELKKMIAQVKPAPAKKLTVTKNSSAVPKKEAKPGKRPGQISLV